MEKQLLQVRRFQETIGAPLPNSPEMLPKKRATLRHNLLIEEVMELRQAKTLNEVADALCDILYISYGTAHEYGMADRLIMLFDEVHKSNMTKFPNGEVITSPTGKIMKPDSFREPKLGMILNRKFHLYKKVSDDAEEMFSDKIDSYNNHKNIKWSNDVEKNIQKNLSFFKRTIRNIALWLDKKSLKNVEIKYFTDRLYNNACTVTTLKGSSTVTDSDY